MCLICGWIYDEAAGMPEEGIAPGTRWEDVPVNWVCPECGELHGEDEECPPPCVECETPTRNSKDGKPCCPECEPPHDCSDYPCDRHNPWSGRGPW